MSKTSIAVFGLTGALGKPVLEALGSSQFADKIQFPVKAISRSDHASTDTIQYIKADLSETEKIASELSGTDVIIELTAPTSDIFASIEEIVAQVKPKLFIPSQFGVDINAVEKYAPGFLGQKQAHSANVRKLGVKVVDIVTGFFAVPGTFLYEWVAHVGVNSQESTLEVRGDINQNISYSSLSDIANAVVATATHSNPSELPDLIKFQSGQITVKEITNSFEKKHNVKLTTTREISKDQALSEFQELLAKGFNPNDFFSYLHYIVSQGDDNGVSFTSTDNELLNPNESVWKYSKYQV
jgi:nucleoside-diphosphate-sugar epimerase